MERELTTEELVLTNIDEFDAISIEIRRAVSPSVNDGQVKVMNVKYPAKLHARKSAKALGVDNGVIFLKGEMTRHYEDSDMGPTFHQARYFYYITGANIEDCAATYDIAKDHLILWLPYKDPRQELYLGTVPTPEDCKAASDIDSVGLIANITPYLLTTLSPSTPLFVLHQSQMPNLSSLHTRPIVVDSSSLQPAMARAREIKTPYEIDMIRRANHISSAAHRAVLEQIAHNLHTERDVEAAFVSSCLVDGGARNQAYEVIAAAGSNAATLHYDKNDQPLQGKQLLVLDAGAEWKRYASDITRTIPLGDGKGGVGFTPQAAAIYAIVEKMQEECIERAGPGVPYRMLQIHAQHVAVEELLKLGILKGETEKILAAGTIAGFFPHGLGHHIGLDVHDVSAKSLLARQDSLETSQRIGKRVLFTANLSKELFTHATACPADKERHVLLEPGMVVTIEPGLYFCRSWLEAFFLESPVHSQYIDAAVLEGFFDVGGVRIEDCILITEDGYENLTTAPKGEDMLRIIRGTVGDYEDPMLGRDSPLEHQAAAPDHPGPGGSQATCGNNHALQDYQTQLMLLERQNKKRRMMACQEQDAAAPDHPGPGRSQATGGKNYALQDYQTQLMLLEHQNKKRLRMARQEQDAAAPDHPGPGGSQATGGKIHALQDYQTQLMLLEQQNKKRLMMARQEQDAAGIGHDGGSGTVARQP